MELFLKADTWFALATLCFLEIVLGIDNIIFISIVSNKLPEEQRRRTRNIGLALAMVVRVFFLLTITWIMGFKATLFTLPSNFIFDHPLAFTGRDIILGLGGLFLIGKSTSEINHEMEGSVKDDANPDSKSTPPGFYKVIIQIVLLDIVFSFDSILTAVGVVDTVVIMIMAVVFSIGVMMFFAGTIGRFIQSHPSMEVLALGFLILIGFMLFLESLHYVIPKGYIYFAVIFSLLIETINIKVRGGKRTKPVKLKRKYNEPEQLPI